MSAKTASVTRDTSMGNIYSFKRLNDLTSRRPCEYKKVILESFRLPLFDNLGFKRTTSIARRINFKFSIFGVELSHFENCD